MFNFDAFFKNQQLPFALLLVAFLLMLVFFAKVDKQTGKK